MFTSWSTMPKSATDNETIEEAIARIIEEHNDDNESHLGVDQSLQSHKVSEIIDHLLGSLVADKLSNREFIFNFLFESLDNYICSASGLNVDVGGFKLDTGSTINTPRFMRATSQYSRAYFKEDRESSFQCFAYFSAITNQLGYITLGGNKEYGDPPGVGFKIINGTLYALEAVWGDPDFVEYTEEITGVSVNSFHVYRVHVRADDNEIDYYVDGVLESTLDLHTSEDVGLQLFNISIENTAAEQKQLSVNGIFIGINPNVI